MAIAATGIEIRDIEISGLEYSNARVVERELPFSRGDIWRPEFVKEGERRLRNLDLFSEAVISPPDDSGVVRIRVNGKWPLWLLPEASRSDSGSSSAGLTLTHYNLWGLHHHLRLATRWDTGTNFTANNGNSNHASYKWRRISDSNFGFDVAYSGGRGTFDAYQNAILTSTYTRERQNWSTGISYGFGPVPGEGWDVRLGFSSSDTRYTLKSGPLLPDVRNLIKKSLQLSAGYHKVDNQITWLTGYLFDYNLSVAHSSLGSDINSYKQQVSIRRHLNLDQQNTLSYRINTGLATGEVLRDGLFDVGNRNSIRGYFPGELQGAFYVFGTLEGRFPLEINSNFQLVTFVDAGHVRLRGASVLGKAIVAGVGGGVRWTLRWLVNGTLRADVAYGTATHRWRAYFGTGQAF